VQNFSFKGYDELTIHGSIYRPSIKKDKYPVMIFYHGLNDNRGKPEQFKPYLDLGYAVITYDFRHQNGLSGEKNKMKIYESIDQAEHSMFLKLYIDALRVIDVASKIVDLDMKKLCVHGFSQGGGLALVVAALDPRPQLVLADVPSMSDFLCRIDTKSGMFKEVHENIENNVYHKEVILKSLAYFDLMHFAEQITAEVIISVGSNDPVCPKQCILKTFQRISSKKQLITYETNTHEGGGLEHLKVKLERLTAFK